MRPFETLTEREILALAIALEEEDARIYDDFADGLREDYPEQAKKFNELRREEDGHRHRLLELYKQRFGDHVPLEGRFPTQHWVPGYYITDEHLMAPDRAMQPAGFYQIFMGMFAGDTRLKVVSGTHDGEHRVRLGGIQVR